STSGAPLDRTTGRARRSKQDRRARRGVEGAAAVSRTSFRGRRAERVEYRLRASAACPGRGPRRCAGNDNSRAHLGRQWKGKKCAPRPESGSRSRRVPSNACSSGPDPRTGTQRPMALKILLSAEQIQRRVKEIGQQVSRDYAGKNLMLLCVLPNGFVFAADLIRAIEIPVTCQFVQPQKQSAPGDSSHIQIHY